MKNKTVTIVMSAIIIFIITIASVLIMMAWKEISKLEKTTEAENFQTTISEHKEEKENINVPNIIENNPFKALKSENTEKNNMNYNQIQIDKYFYNQLEEESKTFYRAFESNKEEMKTGVYKVELGNTFSDLLNSENGSDMLGKYYQSAIEAYTYDNPDIFYLSPNKMFLNIETTTTRKGNTYRVYVNNGDKPNYLTNEFSSKEQINIANQELEQVKNELVSRKTKNTYQNIKLVHDYLINNIEYDQTISQPHIYTVYGALVRGKAVCEGYAKAFKYIMDAMNIPCVQVIGTGTNSKGQTENHAWNYVQLNGMWYAVDCTWDDPIIRGKRYNR